MKYLKLLLLGLLLSSCTSEHWETFHSLEYDVDGITLTRNDLTKSDEATVPAEGCTFTFVGKGEYSAATYVSSIEIDGRKKPAEGRDVTWKAPDSNSPSAKLFRGEWGEFEYENFYEPYIIHFTISPNESDKARVIEVNLGHGYWIGGFVLNQPAK